MAKVHYLPKVIKTAEQWQRELRSLEVNPIEDVRDDVISLIRNAKLSFPEVEAKGGPTAGTLNKWMDKETKRPQFATLQRALHAIGKDFYIGVKR